MARKKSTIEILLSAKDTGLRAAFNKAQRDINNFSKSVSSATAPVRGLISSAISLKTTMVGLATTIGAGVLVRSLIDAGNKMGNLKLSFLAISGSGQGAAKEMEFVRTTADALGLDLVTTADAYKQISAAAMGTTLAGKQTQAIFTAVAKASTTLGLSADETSGALLAISQMISKGKVSAEELRGQLGERLPGAFQIAAKAMGVTTGELDKMMSNGEVMANDFIPKFAQALEQRFGKSAENASNTFTAAQNRITSSLFLIKSGIGEAVTNNNFFVTAMNNAGKALKTLADDMEGNKEKWREWAKQSALSVLDFTGSTVTALDGLYSAFNAVNYAVDVSIGKVYQLRASWLEGSVAGAKFRDEMRQKWILAPVDENGEVAKLTKQLEDAKTKSSEFALSAEKNWQEMQAGSGTLQDAAERIKKYREAMAQIKPTEVIKTEEAEKVKDEIVKIGDKFYNTSALIEKANAATGKDVTSVWDKAFEEFKKSGSKSIDDLLAKIEELAKDRTMTLTVKKVEANSTGGLIGAFKTGGLIGSIMRLANGGKLPGYGGGDRISALLEAGEFVVRKEAVSRYGSAFFSALNNLHIPEIPKFSFGGPVGFASGGAVAGGDTVTLNLNFPGGSSASLSGTRDDVRRTVKGMQDLQRRASR